MPEILQGKELFGGWSSGVVTWKARRWRWGDGSVRCHVMGKPREKGAPATATATATATAPTPFLCRSKPLCFSCLYLFTCVSLALYLSLSPTKCIFRSSPFDPVQSPLFSYPSSYGQNKHSLPTLRSSCSSPVSFSDYWSVLKEIRESQRNSSSSVPALKYMAGELQAVSFGGNFSVERRISFFDDNGDEEREVPCGFIKPFPINAHDRAAMENCNEVVVVSAIFGDHDKIRQPRGIGSKTLQVACFFMFVDDSTLRGLVRHRLIISGGQSSEYRSVGAWRLVNVSAEELYPNAAMNGVIPKYLVHRLFPNSKYSIWVDAKIQLVVDPLLLIHSLVIKENADMAISKHPFFVHTMEEAIATARWRKWLDIDALRVQMETYCDNGLRPWSSRKLPYTSDVPDSAVILRKHGPASNLFSCMMFNELDAFNPRDQLAFAYVRDKMSHTKLRININMFEVEVFEKITLEYRHNMKQGGPAAQAPTIIRAKTESSLYGGGGGGGGGMGRCRRYFLEMWSESN
ncbi:Alkaline ceramidase tod1 [Dionaea muscipula]